MGRSRGDMFTAGCDSVKCIFFPFCFSFFGGGVGSLPEAVGSAGLSAGWGTGRVNADPFQGVLIPVRGWGLRACPGPDLGQAAGLAGAGGGADFFLLPASRWDDNNESERGGAGARPGFSGPVARWLGKPPPPWPPPLWLLRGPDEAMPAVPAHKGWAFAAAAGPDLELFRRLLSALKS